MLNSDADVNPSMQTLVQRMSCQNGDQIAMAVNRTFKGSHEDREALLFSSETCLIHLRWKRIKKTLSYV